MGRGGVIPKNILSTSTIRNIWRPVRRICMLTWDGSIYLTRADGNDNAWTFITQKYLSLKSKQEAARSGLFTVSVPLLEWLSCKMHYQATYNFYPKIPDGCSFFTRYIWGEIMNGLIAAATCAFTSWRLIWPLSWIVKRIWIYSYRKCTI